MVEITPPLPADLARIAEGRGAVPDAALIEPGLLCVFHGRYFVRAGAGLPLGRPGGPGVWVELTSDDFGRFLLADEAPLTRRTFWTEGTLGSDWPGFPGLVGVPVVVRAVRGELRVTEVWVDAREHPAFHRACRSRVARCSSP